MGPTKAIVRENSLYEVVGGKLIKDGFASRQELEDYVNHHYLALPVLDKAGNNIGDVDDPALEKYKDQIEKDMANLD